MAEKTQVPKEDLKLTVAIPLYIDPELKGLVESLIGRNECRNDVIHRLLATHPDIDRLDLAKVQRKAPGRPRKEMAVAE